MHSKNNTDFEHISDRKDGDEIEKSMEGHWPKFMIPADMALDLADRWEANE